MTPTKRLFYLLAGWAAAATAPAQLPGGDDIARALQAAQPQAQAVGLALRSSTLWLAALRQRVPLVAAYAAGVCQIGYSAYTPGQDFHWLFPDLPPEPRTLWLAGFMHHELAHCADQADPASDPADRQAEHPATTTAPSGAAGHPGLRWREVLADLGFAVYVDRHGPDGAGLIRRLAALRASQGPHDPEHDTSAELLCYLQQPPEANQRDDAWLARLRSLRARCFKPAGLAPGRVASD
jgi:hypothetical protein